MLKNILSLLLSKFYSKQESALVARQGIPDYSSDPTTLTLTSTDSSFKATAPFDCFFVGRADILLTSNIAGATGVAVSEVMVNHDNKIFGTSVFENKSGYARKGEEIQVVLDPWGNTSTRNYKILCYKLVGGGSTLKKLLLQGGGLCLSHWYSSLRRSSLLAKRNGSEVKVFSQTQIPEQRSLLTTLRLSFIRLQVMDGLHSAETGHRSMSALPESWERVALTLKVISELQLRFGRGIPLVSIARRTISNRLRQNSFLAKGQRSTSLVGGASC